jgi:hypothetical protein
VLNLFSLRGGSIVACKILKRSSVALGDDYWFIGSELDKNAPGVQVTEMRLSDRAV